MDKSVTVNKKFDFVYVVDDKLVIVVHIKTLFFKIHILRGCKLKIILLIGLHHLKYLEMIDVGKSILQLFHLVAIIKLKTYIPFIMYQPVFKHVIYYFT